MISLSAPSALSEICKEIETFREPANPALGRIVSEAYATFKEGGAVVGFYGSGKSLAAVLSAIGVVSGGGSAVVVAAYRLFEAGGRRVRLAEVVSPAFKEYEECEELERWAAERVGGRAKHNVRRRLDELLAEELSVEGTGFEAVARAALQLVKRGFFLVVDEFERVVESWDSFGFRDLRDVAMKFFEMVDVWPRAGLTIPTSLWAHLDLQTISRVSPVYFLSYAYKTEDLKEFMKRKLGKVPPPIDEVEFRNPRSVAQIIREIESSGGAEKVVERRVEWLRTIAESYLKLSHRRKMALAAAYLAAWFMQSAYAEIPPEKLKKATEYIGSDDPYRLLRGRQLLLKTSRGYRLAPRAVEHLEESLTAPGELKKPMFEMAHLLRYELQLL